MAPPTAAPGPHPIHAPGPVVGGGQAFLHTMELCLGPAVFMLVMSFAVFCRKPSQTFVSMMQHFGAGIVLSAVATELLPAMSAQAHDRRNKASATLATLIGFFAGVAMMVGVAHFCGEPEEDEDEGEEHEAEGYGYEAEAGALDATGSTGHSTIPSPTRRLREVMAMHAGHGHAPLSPGRGGGSSMMQRSMSIGRRKTLMETYREAALETSSPIPISGTLRQQLRHQQRLQDDAAAALSASAQQQGQGQAAPNERTALLRRSLTAGAAAAAAAGGAGGASMGANGGTPGSPPPGPLTSTLSGSEKQQRKEQLAHKYDSDGDEEAGTNGAAGGGGGLHRPRARRSSSASSSSGGQSNGGGGGGAAAAGAGGSAVVPKGVGFGAGGGAVVVYGAVPWTLVVPVYVDSFMDGLLIGLSAVAGQSAGLVMSVALTIEMGFLGLTFSAGVGKVRPALRNLLVVGAPLMILVGGAIGALAAAALSANPILQVGLIAFGVAALLYLVTEELLVEAHEGGEPHVWYVDMMFFLGFIASVLLEQTIQDQELQQAEAKEQAAQVAAAVVAAAVAKRAGGGVA